MKNKRILGPWQAIQLTCLPSGSINHGIAALVNDRAQGEVCQGVHMLALTFLITLKLFLLLLLLLL